MYLIGSKVDLVEQREVDKETARAFCQENGIEKYFETSSVTGFNVEEVFSMSAKDMYVRECVQNEAPATPQPPSPKGNSGGAQKGLVTLEKSTGKSLAEKNLKKDKGCC